MADKKKTAEKATVKETQSSKKCCGGGNAIVVVLLVLVIAAVGVLAFMSGKLSNKPMQRAAAPQQAAKNTQPNAGAVLAEVNGEQITLGEVKDSLGNIPPQMQQLPQEQLIPFALQQLINNKLLSQQAESAGLENDQQVLEQLEAAKAQIIRSKFIGDKIAEGVTDERVKTEYEQYTQNFEPQDQVKASHILVEEEAKAKEIIKKLNAGDDFAELAKENSIDGTAQNGGDLGFFTKEDMVPEFADAAFALEVGKHSKTPVKTQFGFHVIKLAEKGKSKPAAYEQIEPYIRQSLNQTVLNEYIMGLNKEAEIKRFDMAGNEIKPTQQEPAAGDEEEAAAPAEEAEQPAQEEEGAAE